VSGPTSRNNEKCLRAEDDSRSPCNDKVLPGIDRFGPLDSVQFHELGNADIVSAGDVGEVLAFFYHVFTTWMARGDFLKFSSKVSIFPSGILIA